MIADRLHNRPVGNRASIKAHPQEKRPLGCFLQTTQKFRLTDDKRVGPLLV
jgi:hypothetical protein